MKTTMQLGFAIIIAIAGFFTLPAFPQNEKTIGIDSDGEFHAGSRITIGGKTLKKGMYRMSQIFVNGGHFIVIRKVAMNRYGKGMGPSTLGEEVGRLKCVEVPIDKPNRNSKILMRRNALDDFVVIEVWFRGERVKHVLPAS